MKIEFLGTGAADWDGVDERGEKRGYASALINDALMIDCTRDALEALHGRKVDHLLITHSHSDHYEPEAVARLAPLQLYGHESWVSEGADAGVEPHPLAIGQWTRIAGMKVMALPANHTTERVYETAVGYLIDDGKTLVMYMTDSCWPLTRTGDIMAEQKIRPLDAYIVDCTVGFGQMTDERLIRGHMSVEMVQRVRDVMVASGRLKQTAPVYLTHLARTLHPDFRTLEASLRPPYIAARDGMVVLV